MRALASVTHRTPIDDASLVSTVANGNLEALGELFERHEPAVRRYLGRMGVSASDADDLVQGTFLELGRAAPRFDPSMPVRAWLLGIASIVVRRHRRTTARGLARLRSWFGSTERASPATPHDIVQLDETTRRLQQALTRLSEKKREAFVLVVLEGLSGDQAALALGIPVNTLWTRLHHARVELRCALEGGA